MANINRGEYDLTVGETTYSLVLTLEELANLENVLDVGGEVLLQQMRAGQSRISYVNSIITRAFARGRPRLSKKEIEDLIPQIGFSNRKMAAMMLVAGALNYLNEQQPETTEGEEPVEQKNGVPQTPLSSLAEN